MGEMILFRTIIQEDVLVDQKSSITRMRSQQSFGYWVLIMRNHNRIVGHQSESQHFNSRPKPKKDNSYLSFLVGEGSIRLGIGIILRNNEHGSSNPDQPPDQSNEHLTRGKEDNHLGLADELSSNLINGNSEFDSGAHAQDKQSVKTGESEEDYRFFG